MYKNIRVYACMFVDCTFVQLNFSLPEPNMGRKCLINVLFFTTIIQIYGILILFLVIILHGFLVRTEIFIFTCYKYISKIISTAIFHKKT
jgi:hypothetical protein